MLKFQFFSALFCFVLFKVFFLKKIFFLVKAQVRLTHTFCFICLQVEGNIVMVQPC